MKLTLSQRSDIEFSRHFLCYVRCGHLWSHVDVNELKTLLLCFGNEAIKAMLDDIATNNEWVYEYSNRIKNIFSKHISCFFFVISCSDAPNNKKSD